MGFFVHHHLGELVRWLFHSLLSRRRLLSERWKKSQPSIPRDRPRSFLGHGIFEGFFLAPSKKTQGLFLQEFMSFFLGGDDWKMINWSTWGVEHNIHTPWKCLATIFYWLVYGPPLFNQGFLIIQKELPTSTVLLKWGQRLDLHRHLAAVWLGNLVFVGRIWDKKCDSPTRRHTLSKIHIAPKKCWKRPIFRIYISLFCVYDIEYNYDFFRMQART